MSCYDVNPTQEPYSAMDCDLIGAPCLPMCGWRPVLLHAYVLPRVHSCVDHSYFDYTTILHPTARMLW